tara:strand:+ start:881 stop:1414 length:534 start_codon:yes stop_codon:yes gene_type:complete
MMNLEERLNKFLKKEPSLDDSVYIAKGAIVIGSVELGSLVNVWHNATIRGDINFIKIGEGSNIQDNALVHLADDYGVTIGSYVTVGHSAIVHACSIEDECLIGMHATILDGAVIGKQSIVGAGALITKNMKIPEGSLVLGSPAKIIRTLNSEERNGIKNWAEKYIKIAEIHKSHFNK